MIKNFAKKAISSSSLLSFLKGNRFIFCYHDISDKAAMHHSPIYSTNSSLFIKQIDILRKMFVFIPLNELIENKNLSNENYASITFDDGFYSILSFAHPLLSSYSIPYTIFLNKGAMLNNRLWVSDIILNQHNPIFLKKIYNKLFPFISSINFEKFSSNPIEFIKTKCNLTDTDKYLQGSSHVVDKVYLDEQDVIFLSKQSVDFGSHTVNHFNLAMHSSSLVAEEIKENKIYLEELLDRPIKHFAIPFGKKENYSQLIMDAILANHNYAYTTNPNKISPNDRYLFPRIGITNDTIEGIKFYLNRTFLKKYDI